MNNISRRRALAVIPAAAAITTLPALANETDPLVKLHRQYEIADREWRRLDDAEEEAEIKQWCGTENYREYPHLIVGRCDCYSVFEIRRASKEHNLSVEQAAEALTGYEVIKADYAKARQRAGLAEFDDAVKTAKARERALYLEIATTPVVTLEGVAVKLKFLCETVEVGLGDHDEDMVRTALEGVERIGGAV